MRKFILLSLLAATAVPGIANAQSMGGIRHERRELRQERRELRRDTRDVRRDRIAYVAPYLGWAYRPVTGCVLPSGEAAMWSATMAATIWRRRASTSAGCAMATTLCSSTFATVACFRSSATATRKPRMAARCLGAGPFSRPLCGDQFLRNRAAPALGKECGHGSCRIEREMLGQSAGDKRVEIGRRLEVAPFVKRARR